MWIQAACGGGGIAADEPRPTEDAVPRRFVLRVQGFDASTGYATREEAPVPWGDATSRRILTTTGGRYTPPPSWSLIDMAVHPSGELSAVLATQGAQPLARLVRLNERAQVVSDTPLEDLAAPPDRYFGEEGTDISDDNAMLPLHTRDTVRLAALGEEDLAVALRTGRYAVVAYPYLHTNQGYAQRWRNMVVPGTSTTARHLAGSSHDTYGQLVNHFQVLLATNAQGEWPCPPARTTVLLQPTNATFSLECQTARRPPKVPRPQCGVHPGQWPGRMVAG